MNTSLVKSLLALGVCLWVSVPACAATQESEDTIASPSEFLPTPLDPSSADAPVDLGAPVATEALEAIDPDALGLLTAASGGLGAALWKDTPRVVVERLLPETTLPTPSKTLNALARRLLLSTAAVPTGSSVTNQSFMALRLEKLLALGATREAWQLSQMTKAGQVDDITLRRVTEAALLGPDSKAVCDKIPDIIAAHSGVEWQKSLILCQIRAGNLKAAQLGLDLLREQQASNDLFMALVAHNVLGDAKKLPRLTTPLQPLALGIAQTLNQPLPPEFYAHPEAALIPALLRTKATDEKTRLALAEQAAAWGLLGAEDLAALYRDVSFTPDALANATTSAETDGRLHALLYQAAQQEQAVPRRVDILAKWTQALNDTALRGGQGRLLAERLAPLPAANDFAAFAVTAARVAALADKPDQARPWLALVRDNTQPDIVAQKHANWPLFVLAGLISDDDYGQQVTAWLETALAPSATPKTDRAQREKAGHALLLLNAAGFAVPDSAWERVIDVGDTTARTSPPSPLLLEQLRNAGELNRKGEAILLSLLLAGNDNAPLTSTLTAIKSLRQVGLTAEASALAREALEKLD